MATIIQINRIATNRPGAVTDTVERLQSSETDDVVNIAAQHLPLDMTSFTITDGVVSATPTPVNLTDVQTYATTTARNADTTTTWHVGDVAIVTGPTTIAGAFANSGITTLATPSSTTLRLSSGTWDTTTNEPVGIEVGDVIQLRSSSGTIAGSTRGGPDLTITAIASFNNSNQALITVDTALFPDSVFSPLGSSGDQVWIQSSGMTIPAGTYVYTGTDQTDPAATTNDDWTVLRTPTAAELGEVPVTRTAQTASLTLTPTPSTGVTVTGDDVSFANTLFTYTAGGTGIPTFPTAATTVLEIYVDGLKISSNEVGTITGTSFTLTGAREALTNSGNFVVEIVWRD